MRRVNRNINSLKSIEDLLADITISYQTRTHLNSDKLSSLKHHAQNISSNGDRECNRDLRSALCYGDVEKCAS
jgi:transposase